MVVLLVEYCLCGCCGFGVGGGHGGGVPTQITDSALEPKSIVRWIGAYL